MNSERIGFQSVEDWMGGPVLTLADVWPPTPWAAIVGLNPAPKSVEIGHYYQGRAGQRQLRRLVDIDLLDPPENSYFEESAIGRGVGFTDIVKRASAGEGDIRRDEIEHGRVVLEAALIQRNVQLVICVFRHPVQALLGTSGTAGFQDRVTSWGARVFRMPGPYENRAVADAVMDTLGERRPPDL